MKHVEDIIQCWYFTSLAEAEECDTNKAEGYTKVVNGTLKVNRGVTTSKYTFIKSETKVSDVDPRKLGKIK